MECQPTTTDFDLLIQIHDLPKAPLGSGLVPQLLSTSFVCITSSGRTSSTWSCLFARSVIGGTSSPDPPWYTFLMGASLESCTLLPSLIEL